MVLRNIWQSLRFHATGHVCKIAHNPKHIVLVCKGNICRSAFAEHYLRMISNSEVVVESVGLDADQGVSSPAEAVRVACAFGVDLSLHKPRKIDMSRMITADLIIGMEYDHYRRLVQMMPNKHEQIRLLRTFLPFPYKILVNIDDPYNRGVREYERCFFQISRAVSLLTKSTAICRPFRKGVSLKKGIFR